MTSLILTIIMVSTMFTLAKHPLSLALLLIMNTTLMALYGGFLNLSYWYSFMLFMIMIGGMLVLIMYMTSIAANEMLDPSWKFMIMTTSAIFSVMIMPDMLGMNLNIKPLDMAPINEWSHNLSLNKYLSDSHMTMIFMLINYLLITLIAIVKITNIKYGALRQKF